MSDEAASESAPPAKKTMNPLVLVMVASLVTAATVGGGVYFALASKVEHAAAAADDEEEEAPAAAEEGATKKKGKGKNKKAEKKEPALYVKLDPPFVVNFEAKGIMRFLQISVELMTRDPQTVDLLTQHEPMIRNNLLMLFGNQNFDKINSTEGKEALRTEALKSISDSLKGEGAKPNKVEQLYFTSFVMQ